MQNHSKRGRKSIRSLFRLKTKKTTQIEHVKNDAKTTEQVGKEKRKKKNKVRKFFKM